MTQDKEREAYEKWVIDDGGHHDLLKRAVTGEYEEEWVSHAWWGWQARAQKQPVGGDVVEHIAKLMEEVYREYGHELHSSDAGVQDQFFLRCGQVIAAMQQPVEMTADDVTKNYRRALKNICNFMEPNKEEIQVYAGNVLYGMPADENLESAFKPWPPEHTAPDCSIVKREDVVEITVDAQRNQRSEWKSE